MAQAKRKPTPKLSKLSRYPDVRSIFARAEDDGLAPDVLVEA